MGKQDHQTLFKLPQWETCEVEDLTTDVLVTSFKTDGPEWET